jgi:hypothetical protein
MACSLLDQVCQQTMPLTTFLEDTSKLLAGFTNRCDRATQRGLWIPRIRAEKSP